MGKLLRGFCGAVLGILWLVFCIVGGLPGAIGCVICLTIAGVWMAKRTDRKERELSGDFASYEGGYAALSEKELTKILLGEELRRMQYDRPVSKTSVKWRCILTVAYAILNFVTLERWYCSEGILFASSLLALTYVLLFVGFNTPTMLYRNAKAISGKPFRDVIREDVYENDYNHTGRRVLMIGVLAVSIAGFFCLHAAPRCSYVKNEEGYTLKQYRPAILSFKEAQIPDSFVGEPVTAIGDRVFAGQMFLEAVSVPDSVLTIGKQAFQDCGSLKSVSLGSNLRSIGSGAFKGCDALEQIQLPKSLTELLGESFQNCSKLQSITIPEGVTEIRGNTFENCSALTQVQLHDGIIDIHAYAFRGCSSLEQIQLPPKITEIHANTFENCYSLKSIVIPKGVLRIAAHAFNSCGSLKSVSVPDTVVEIGSSAFRNCGNLKRIELPGYMRVDARAFKDSPTEIVRHQLGDDSSYGDHPDVTVATVPVNPQDINDILEGIENSKPVGEYFCAYEKENPEEIVEWTEHTVLVANKTSVETYIHKGLALQGLADEQALMEYLEAAKEAGITQVLYYHYESGYLGPIIKSIAIDDMIAQCQNDTVGDLD